MPHSRQRYLLPLVQKSLKHTPIVGILGQRQTGETTLMMSLVDKDRYASLDQRTELEAAQSAPESFLERGPGLFGIDECQLAPEVFPALKEHVRVKKSPGQYLLTGSVRFTSRKLIRESLTGRIVTHELLPLTLAETHDLDMSDVVRLIRLPLKAMKETVSRRLRLVSDARANEYLVKGGLPGICFFRDSAVRNERLGAHLDTILRRDLRLVLETTLPFEKLLKALRYFALQQGRAWSASELSRYARISAPTLQRLIPAFESLFLLRRVESVGDLRKDRFFHEDQGVASFLMRESDPARDLERLLFSAFFAQMRYLYPHEGTLQTYETRAGARVPLVLEVNGEKTGLIPLTTEAPDASALAAAKSFQSRFPGARVAILTRSTQVTPMGPGTFALPYRAAL